MIEVSLSNEMTDLSLGNPNALGKLFWRFQSLIRFMSLNHLSLQPAPSRRTPPRERRASDPGAITVEGCARPGVRIAHQVSCGGLSLAGRCSDLFGSLCDRARSWRRLTGWFFGFRIAHAREAAPDRSLGFRQRRTRAGDSACLGGGICQRIITHLDLAIVVRGSKSTPCRSSSGPAQRISGASPCRTSSHSLACVVPASEGLPGTTTISPSLLIST